jgi:hypothetical protein
LRRARSLSTSRREIRYGSAILGYHLYTWAFLCFVAAIAASAAVLFSDEQFEATSVPELGLFEQAAVWLVVAVTLLNAGGALIECGFSWCPADPIRYELISRPG